jgi:hypothetical protein
MVKKRDVWRQSSLYGDLSSESHDSLYRAMSYILRCGGPSITGSHDDLPGLCANRAMYLNWLMRRQDADRIIGEYEEFKKRWSPVYMD